MNKTMLSHRVAWIIDFGPIPAGLSVCHHCDTPPCCNPSHLFLGTHRENMADQSAKGRAKGGSTFGTKQASAKLTDADIPEIRRLRAQGMYLYKIAERFDVSTRAITFIIKGTHWKHVP